jgi:hypothetical protein
MPKLLIALEFKILCEFQIRRMRLKLPNLRYCIPRDLIEYLTKIEKGGRLWKHLNLKM